MNGKEELLKKLKALAERGESGERENAAAQLEKLMKKYGVSEEELERDAEQDCFFRYSQETERRLLMQIVFSVTGKAGSETVGTYTGRKRKKVAVKCTAAQKLEIEALYAFYKAAFEEELETFYSAFFLKNHIYPPPNLSEGKSFWELTPEEIERYKRAEQMAGGMEKHNFRKQLTAGDKERDIRQ